MGTVCVAVSTNGRCQDCREPARVRTPSVTPPRGPLRVRREPLCDQREDTEADTRKVRSCSARCGAGGHCGVKGRKHRGQKELKENHPEGRPNIRGARDDQVEVDLQPTSTMRTSDIDARPPVEKATSAPGDAAQNPKAYPGS